MHSFVPGFFSMLCVTAICDFVCSCHMFILLLDKCGLSDKVSA